jgi:hypothetical protein
MAEKCRDNPQTLKTAGRWLGGIGAPFVLMGSGIWSFLGLCMLGAAFATYHLLSVHYDSPCKPALFRCPYCSHQMNFFQNWKCRHCGTLNEARNRTFVEECANSDCGNKPHSLMCSACGKIIIFDQYKYKLSPDEYAHFADAQPRETGPAEDTLSERRKRLQL